MSRERPEDRSIQSWMADLAIHSERVADGIDELNAAIRAKVATGPGGMSLRDWFAGMAMAGMSSQVACEDLACRCYALADAMLAAREQK